MEFEKKYTPRQMSEIIESGAWKDDPIISELIDYEFDLASRENNYKTPEEMIEKHGAWNIMGWIAVDYPNVIDE